MWVWVFDIEKQPNLQLIGENYTKTSFVIHGLNQQRLELIIANNFQQRTPINQITFKPKKLFWKRYITLGQWYKLFTVVNKSLP